MTRRKSGAGSVGWGAGQREEAVMIRKGMLSAYVCIREATVSNGTIASVASREHRESGK